MRSIVLSACVASGVLAQPATQSEHQHGPSDHTRIAAAEVDDPRGDVLFSDAKAAFAAGRFDGAVAALTEAVRSYSAAGQRQRWFETMALLSAAHHALGQQQKAMTVASEGLTVAVESGDRMHESMLLTARGRAAMFSRDAESAEADLVAAGMIARELSDDALLAAAANDLGILYAARGSAEEALEAYDTAADAAERIAAAQLVATARANSALAAAESAHGSAAERIGRAMPVVGALPATYAKGHLLITLADARLRLIENDSSPSQQDLRQCYDAAMAAQSVAQTLPSALLESYAWGRLGELYGSQNREEEAIFATRKAVFLSQQAKSDDATFWWQWQLGRLLRDAGQLDPAIEAYRRALASLRGIRHDLSIGFGNRNSRSSFRQKIGPVFYETADLLLRKAEELQDENLRQESLKIACETIEELKSAELEDYFQDDCVNLMKQKSRGIDVGLVNTAIVYLIPLKDRTEILLSTQKGLARFRADVTDEALTAEVKALRGLLEDEVTYDYRAPAGRIYDWLMRPIHKALEDEQIDTLVFVPDGELRTIPMSALYDSSSKKHLIETFAVAVSPGLELTDPRPLPNRKKVEILAAGISEARQDFPALPSVPAELSAISTMFGGVQLKDAQFQRKSFASQFQGESFTIVHIASHGRFERDAAKTFVLTYDEKLRLNDLEKLIQPSQFRGEPVELLTLSACQTATGDDGARAALGLAGIAIKAGARSALASLWSVNDAASGALIGEFYAQLAGSATQTKARALQAAQLSLLTKDNYQHPRYWAPYLIIGNWK